jgi:hypothetical protein
VEAPAWQELDPEFKPMSYQKKRKEKKKGE